jgi:hypothetical protein
MGKIQREHLKQVIMQALASKAEVPGDDADAPATVH